ncbi:aldo/keto reductase [Candidatus Endobugula sertula]|uniref:Aldo/keto reductase n=1 Tax=Candidatus Endobugula sertula TaxID=62101 RepID=A0A1D2QS04_9GAMM|nr:aldo/keto reductase [Candidatus Endobugula sertula]
MQHTKLGNTGINVSLLGLGTVKIGRNTDVKYPKKFDIPNDQQVIKLLNTAADCGINLIDTAPAYGNSEDRLGKLLPKVRSPWVISTKVGETYNPSTGESFYNFTPEFIHHSVEQSLKKLQRESLDIVLIHSNGNDKHIIEHYGALETLNHLKQKGLIRATGMSTKTVEGGILATQHSDIVMVTHNLMYQEEQDVIDYAYRHNKGIFIKKAFASGHQANNNQNDNIQKSLQCILTNPGISSIILGSINADHIKSNAFHTEIVIKN